MNFLKSYHFLDYGIPNCFDTISANIYRSEDFCIKNKQEDPLFPTIKAPFLSCPFHITSG